MVPYELLQDLNKLVCSSRNKKVEDLFIKLAEEAEEEAEDNSGFYKWLIKNKGNKDLEKLLNSKETLDALSYLAKNKDKLNKEPNHFLWTPSSKYAEVYLSAINLSSSDPGKYGGLLEPFSTFLNILGKFGIKGPPDQKIEADLIKIFDFYNSTKVSPSDHYPDHHHVKPHEMHMHEEESARNSSYKLLQDTKIYRHLFGYLLHGFTESILTAINKTTHNAWDNTKQLLLSRKLPRYGEIMGSLPYIPRMGSSGNKIHELFNSLPGTWKKYGDAETYNIINRKVLSALEMPVPYSTTPQQEMNYDDWYNKKGDPTPNFNSETDKVEKPEAHHMELPYQDVLECSYILCVSALLGKIQERIQNSTE